MPSTIWVETYVSICPGEREVIVTSRKVRVTTRPSVRGLVKVITSGDAENVESSMITHQYSVAMIGFEQLVG